MRRLVAILAVIALVVAACGTTDADPDETAADTTAPVAADIEFICHGAISSYSEDACASFAVGQTTASDELFTPTTGADRVEESTGFFHDCLYFPDHLMVFPDVALENPAQFSLREATIEDLQAIALGEEAEAVLDYLNDPDNQLGLYIRDPDVFEQGEVLEQDLEAADLFGLIDIIESDVLTASPHYELIPADPHWKYGPHDLAASIPGVWEDLKVTNPSSPSDNRPLVIIDTGGIGQTDPVAVNLGFSDPNQETEVSVLPAVAGHGMFAGSIARQFNPELTIDVYRAGGPMSEISIQAALIRAGLLGEFPRADAVDVVNLSLGSYPCREDDPALGLIKAISDLPAGVHVVAASGNDNIDENGDGVGDGHPTMFPASLGSSSLHPALPSALTDNGIDLDVLSTRVTAVGAFDSDGAEAFWSNPAEVLAPGSEVVGWYEHANTVPGLAVWSGTSFAAPHFAACLASGACTPP